MYTMDQIHHIRQLYYEQGLSVTGGGHPALLLLVYITQYRYLSR